MEPRASTAPPHASHEALLQSFDRLRHLPASLESTANGQRPHTCPPAVLSPHFHWNLNKSALETLSQTQSQQLYALFTFYTSSPPEATMPSINSARFQEILYDAHLIHPPPSSTSLQSKQLTVESVDRVFAQAVMGQMRVYLDRTDQPALTFPLFCGALLNCALVLDPLARPVKAMQAIVSRLLDHSDDHRTVARNGLLRHVPVESTNWTLEQSQLAVKEGTAHDFRDQDAFQQVIADCRRDELVDKLQQEKLHEIYRIPEHLGHSFHPETLDLIVSKFQTFDIHESGTVPQQEIFSLLSCLGPRTDLPDPFVVLAKLSGGKGATLGTDSTCTNEQVTLVQLLQAFDPIPPTSCQEEAIECPAPLIANDKTETLPSLLYEEDDNLLADENRVLLQKGPRDKKRRKSGDCGRRPLVAGHESRKSILSRMETSQALVSMQHESTSTALLHHENNTKKPILRKKSTILNGKLKGSMVNSDMDTSMLQTPSVPVGATEKCISERDLKDDKVVAENENKVQEVEKFSKKFAFHKRQCFSACDKKMIRIFLLLGGEHDGAIYCTFTLVFATRTIEESEGIFFTAAPCETTRTFLVRPTQFDRMNALLMLKKCVNSKLEQGYTFYPAGQLEIINQLLQDQRNRQPHYRNPLVKTSREGTNAALSTPTLLCALDCKSTLRPQTRSLRSTFDPLQTILPGNLNDVLAAWETSQHETFSWIHDMNATKPFKRNRNGILRPL